MPYISTDSARFVVASNNGLNRQKWFFSAPFAIRPDPRWVDAPPQINLTSPAAGQEFPAGSMVPVSWTASDDEALRGFSIQVSTDGGRNWIQVAENLPPTATNYNWQTPPGGALDDVRLRVVAVDRRYQNSSSGAIRVFRLTSPANAAPRVSSHVPGQQRDHASRPQHLPHGRCLRQRRHDSTRRILPDEQLDRQPHDDVHRLRPDSALPDRLEPRQRTSYTLTARAIDNRNAVTVSSPVTFTVQPGNPAPLPIGFPELTRPEDGQRFDPGSDVTLTALPAASSYSVVRVEFYNGTTLIASDNTSPYEIVWNNVPAGNYTVFAKTIAGNGAEAISKPADITVGPEAPRLTNAVSRKTHGTAGTFDIALPSSGTPGVECRAAGAGGAHTLVFAFNNQITSGSATVANGTGSVSGTIPSGNTLTVNLSGVTDRRHSRSP